MKFGTCDLTCVIALTSWIVQRRSEHCIDIAMEFYCYAVELQWPMSGNVDFRKSKTGDQRQSPPGAHNIVDFQMFVRSDEKLSQASGV